MIVLGIESSCDETGVGIVELHDDGTMDILADVVASSMEQHARFGGVVPEIASRAHLEAMPQVMEKALADAGIDKPDAVAATVGPGLAGALLVSGGHTQLLEVEAVGKPMRELGTTLDDAAGEAYDKVARLLGLGYPGGPVVDKLAAEGNPEAVKFPRALSRAEDLRGEHRYNFSFSGLKTAVARHVEAAERDGRVISLEDVCASFQEAVCDVLTAKAVMACDDTGANTLLLGGGVAANRRLRELAQQRCEAAGIELRVPRFKLCTDNGVMIAALAAQLIHEGAAPSGLGVGTDTSLEVEVPLVSS